MSLASYEQLKLIEAWIRAEYAMRTHAIWAGIANVDWHNPENRITYTEIATKCQMCGIPVDPFQLRELMQQMAKSLLRSSHAKAKTA